MRVIVRSAVLLASFCMLTACGGDTKQDEGTAPAEQAEAVGPARPASFGLCLTCHSDKKDRNGLGPSLFGIVGRQAGALPDYTYSPAMKSAALKWDEAAIDRFMQDPRAVVPGTKMSFPGIKEPEKRAEIVRYLASLK